MGNDVKESQKEEDHLPPDKPGLPPGMVLPIILMIDATRSITHFKPPLKIAK
jgi:hypothetical protein